MRVVSCGELFSGLRAAGTDGQLAHAPRTPTDNTRHATRRAWIRRTLLLGRANREARHGRGWVVRIDRESVSPSGPQPTRAVGSAPFVANHVAVFSCAKGILAASTGVKGQMRRIRSDVRASRCANVRSNSRPRNSRFCLSRNRQSTAESKRIQELVQQSL